jgi:hypothetical protein
MSKPHIGTAAPGSVSWTQLRCVTGIGGQLKSVGIAGGTVYHFVQITIDGNQLVDDYLAGTLASPSHSNTSLALDLPFEHDFEVKVRDDPSGSPATTYWCVYMTNGSERISSVDEIVTQDGIEYLYRREVFRTEENVEYSTRGLVGPIRVSRVRLAEDVVRYGTLRGSVHFESPSTDTRLGVESVDLLVRFPGFQTELVRIPIGEVVGERSFEVGLQSYLNELVFRLPPFRAGPATFEVATDVRGFSNVPVRFVYLPQ